MHSSRPRRTAKDTVFKDLFSTPENLLKLYNGLHPEDTDITTSDIKLITLESILRNGIYNDLGFLAKNRLMILVEAQSTWSPNIVLRGAMYLMTTYQEYFNRNDISLYSNKKVAVPRPELYVVYTKERGNYPDTLSLTDEFFNGIPCAIEARTKVIYLNTSDTIINQYIKFCMVWDAQIKEHGKTMTAIKETLRICRDENLLVEYLNTRETEVEGIMLTLFDQDREDRLWAKELFSDGQAEGQIKGKMSAEINNLRAMMKNLHLSSEQAMQALNIPPSEYAKYSALL